MKWPSRSLVGFVLSLALLAAVGWLNFRHTSRMQAREQWVAHTHQVEASLNELALLISDVESGARGYGITGDEAYLAQFNASLERIEPQLKRVRALTQDNSLQQTNCDLLGPLISERVEVSKQMVNLRRSAGLDAVRQEVLKGMGKSAMDRIRSVVNRMVQEEQTLLEARSAALNTESRNAKIFTLFGIGLSFLILIYVFALVLREKRLRTEAQLQRNRLFEIVPDLIGVCDMEGFFKQINPAFREVLGYEAEEFLAKPLFDFIHPEDVAATQEEIQILEQGYPTLHFENRYRCKDGSWKWLSWKAKPFPKEGLIFCSARDVTELKIAELAAEQARKETAQERERFKFIFDHLPVGVSLTVTDSKGEKTTIINEAHLAICGVSPKEAAEPGIFRKISHPEDYERQHQLFQKVEAGEIQEFSLDKRYLRPDGKIAWVIFSHLRRDHPEGRREDLSFVVDITERKKMEEELRASEENLSVTLHCIGDGVLSTDVEGNILRLNSVAEKLTGWSSKEAVGRPVEEIFHIINEETGQPAIIPLREVMETGLIRGLANHTALVARDGTVRSIADSAAPIRSIDGKLLGAVLVFRDVTEESRLAQAVKARNEELQERAIELEKARAEADRANQAKSEYLSRMSHEFRTPLNAILGFGQLLEQDVTSAADRESVDQILKAGRHLLDMINELLDLARIEAGRLRISYEPVMVSELLRDCVSLIRPLGEERKIRFEEQCIPENDGHVLADRQRLKQVVLNLLSNAIKYNRDGGKVSINCTTTAENRVQIRISDTGAGIAEANLGRLFSPFERLTPEQPRVEGTGLGLALCKRLVELMGGAIGVDSAMGMGSTFWVTLAKAEAPILAVERQLQDLAVVPPPLPQPIQKRHWTVLYIEDNLSNLRLIERILDQRPGVELIPAMQGKLGLELARKHPPDLVLLDLNLPDMHGKEVLLRLKAEPATAAVPVVIISADATAGEIERLRDSGARDYLTKPFNVLKFLRVFDRFLLERPESAPAHPSSSSPMPEKKNSPE